MICRTALSRRNLKTSFSSFATAAAAAATAPPPCNESERSVEESVVYQMSRKFARPATVSWSEQLNNSVSLIGTLEYPFKQIIRDDGTLFAHSILIIKPSPDSDRHFRITLCMRGSLAETALAHLKQNDYIYVSGQLGSYTKSTLEGRERILYKVTAKEFNNVQVPDESYQVAAKSESEADLGETWEQKSRNRLQLWQFLFANPDEWYDQRKTKKSPRHPDFTHKSTGELLWLNTFDPPWVKQQVELLDSRRAGRLSDEVPFGAFASDWVSDHLLGTSVSSVTANELNHVQVPDESYQVAVKSGSEPGESREQKSRNKLHLWQILFANPDEWYDNRRTKKNPRQPDFKHKSTGEALWLNTSDPPWLQKQVELLDSRSSDEVSSG